MSTDNNKIPAGETGGLMKWGERIHRVFRFGIILKFINAAAEIIGGILLLLESRKVANWLSYFFSFELREDPADLVANYVIKLSGYLSIGHHYFPVIYLLFHGSLNMFLAVALWRKKLWAFPWAISLFSLFTLYQVYRLFSHFSFLVLVITVIDVFVIFLTYLDYKIVEKTRNL